MVRLTNWLLQEAGAGISKTLSEILVCPLSKQTLRLSKESTLISDSIGVSFPIKDGIPCLVPTDGKILDADYTMKDDNTAQDSAATNKE